MMNHQTLLLQVVAYIQEESYMCVSNSGHVRTIDYLRKGNSESQHSKYRDVVQYIFDGFTHVNVDFWSGAASPIGEYKNTSYFPLLCMQIIDV
jgi:hypothetical protein